MARSANFNGRRFFHLEAEVATNHPRSPLDVPTSPNLLDESRIHHYKEHLKGPADGRNIQLSHFLIPYAMPNVLSNLSPYIRNAFSSRYPARTASKYPGQHLPHWRPSICVTAACAASFGNFGTFKFSPKAPCQINIP